MVSEGINREMMNALHEAVFLRRFRDGENPYDRFAEVNDAACNLTGYSREELLRLTPLDLTPPSEKLDVDALIKRCRSEKKLVFHNDLVRKNGVKIPVEIANHYFVYEEQVIGLSIVKDFTQPACDALLLDMAKKSWMKRR